MLIQNLLIDSDCNLREKSYIYIFRQYFSSYFQNVYRHKIVIALDQRSAKAREPHATLCLVYLFGIFVFGVSI